MGVLYWFGGLVWDWIVVNFGLVVRLVLVKFVLFWVLNLFDMVDFVVSKVVVMIWLVDVV